MTAEEPAVVAQCPACARFLSNDLVAELASAEVACPRCGTALRASMFEAAPSTPVPAGGAAPSGSVTAAEPSETGAGADPLAGWDRQTAAARPLGASRDPGDTDRAVLGGGILLGGVLGVVLGRRRGRAVVGSLLGALLGVLAAASSRRLWILE